MPVVPSVMLRVFWTNSWISPRRLLLRADDAGVGPGGGNHVCFTGPTGLRRVPAGSAFVGVKATDMPGLRLSETTWPLVLSVAGGMTLETNLSIAW